MPTDLHYRYHLKIGNITRGITMHVMIVGYKGWLLRLKIALLLFRLGAWIADVGIRIEDSPRHLPECGTLYRGCAPDCPKRLSEEQTGAGQHD